MFGIFLVILETKWNTLVSKYACCEYFYRFFYLALTRSLGDKIVTFYPWIISFANMTFTRQYNRGHHHIAMLWWSLEDHYYHFVPMNYLLNWMLLDSLLPLTTSKVTNNMQTTPNKETYLQALLIITHVIKSRDLREMLCSPFFGMFPAILSPYRPESATLF